MKNIAVQILLFLLVKTVNKRTAVLWGHVPGAEAAFLWAVRMDEANWLDKKGLVPRLFPGMRVWLHLTAGVYARFDSPRSGTVLELRNGGALVLHDDGRKYGWDANELLPLHCVSFKTRLKLWWLRQ
jgi:hypothetical protein